MKYIFSLIIFTPVPAFAAVASIQDFLIASLALLKNVVPVVFALALLFFFYGLAKKIINFGDEKAVEEGKRIMLWGTIALFVMASIWGIVALLQSSFGVGGGVGGPGLLEGVDDPSDIPDPYGDQFRDA